MEEIRGLSEAEALARRRRGEGNNFKLQTSRSYWDIFRQNVFAFINIVLFAIGILLVLIDRVEDAIVSVLIILMNVMIGVIQEIRAKRQLDQIALLARPKVTIMREGEEKVVDPAEVVMGDILIVRPGDQLVVDAEVVGEGSMEVDESLLSGESDLIMKKAGDTVLSGSYCVTGSAFCVAEKVGEHSFANRLTAGARKFRTVQTPLQKDVDFVIRLLTLLASFIGILLLISALLLSVPFMRSVQMAAVIAGLIPNGLFLMLVVAYAMGALRIVRSGALVQQSNSVESLSYVNMLCLDKTGTLTANRLQLNSIFPIDAQAENIEFLLASFASSAISKNRTVEAITRALGEQKKKVRREIPFSSERRWSGLIFDDEGLEGMYLLGAVETLTPHLSLVPEMDPKISEWASTGLRVLMFAYSPVTKTIEEKEEEFHIPTSLQPLALVSFKDELRANLSETFSGFKRAGITLKVISGDHPETVASLVKQAGLSEDLQDPISGMNLELMDSATFEKTVEEQGIYGRISPTMKERMIEVLRSLGYYVAMIGDGVNDVLSLKKADLGIAMQSGSAATRGVADMILLNDSFAALPPAFLEGQRIINGMKDILRLFLTRAIYFSLLILSTSVIGIGFPYVPKHATLVTLFSVGIPTLALTAWARPGKVPRGSIIRSILHFVIPASFSVFLFGLIIYSTTYGYAYSDFEAHSVEVSQEEIDRFRASAGIDYPIGSNQEYYEEVATLAAQNTLSTFTLLAGLFLVIFVEPSIPFFVAGEEASEDPRPSFLSLILFVGFVLILLVEPLRTFFELILLPAHWYVLLVVALLIWMFTLRYAWKARWFERFLHLDPEGYREI